MHKTYIPYFLMYTAYMISSLLLSYYLHQFTVPASSVHREDRSQEYIQSVEPEGNIIVEVQSTPSQSVPPGSQRIAMMQLHLSSDCSADVPVYSISLQRRGMGSNADIDSLYVIHRGVRIPRERSISNRDGSVELRLQDFKIPACTAQDLIIAANFSADASPTGQHRLELASIDAGNSSVRIAKSATTMPSISTGTNPVGQIAVEYLSISKSIHYGSRQQIARFRLEADAEDDHEIQSITFTNKGSARDTDVQNVYVEFRNRQISSRVVHLDGNKATLLFDPPIVLQKRQKLSFGLRADIRASRSRTLQFLIEEPSDIISTVARSRQ